MRMAKQSVNLSLEHEAVERARRYSARHGTSISKLVNDYLANLPVDEERERPELTPAVRRLLGVAAGKADRDDYHRYLEEKYGR
jgi:hypothetical protein